MSEVNYELNECILYQHRSIYVDEAQHAAHSRGRHTCAEHGCMSDQTMLLWFLASLPQHDAIVFREKASNGIIALRSTGLGRHIEEHQMFADGKGVHLIRRNHLPRRIKRRSLGTKSFNGIGESCSRPQKIGSKNGFDSATRTITARRVVKADFPFKAPALRARSPKY